MAISEWDQRQLCPDGACVGVIGQDGTCKTCGRVAPDWGDERRRGLVAAGGEASDGEASDGEGDGEDDEDEDEISPSAPAVLGELAEWQRRRLCPDGACVGLIGPDGSCKVCGKAASGEAEAADGEDEAGDEADGDEDGEDEGDEADAGDGEEAEDEAEDGDEAEAEENDDEAAAAGDGGPDDRKLCPDGACIGVIGQDGRCKVCGKEAA